MQPMPQSLKIVACLFIALGVSYIADMLIGLFLGSLRFDAGVIDLPIGYGLLRLRPRALPWALFCTWVGLVLSPVCALILPFVPSHIHFQVFGATVGEIPRALAASLCGVFFALSIWQYSVLTAEPVRRLFDPRVSLGGHDGPGSKTPRWRGKQRTACRRDRTRLGLTHAAIDTE